MEEKMKRLEGMIGNTYRYEGRRIRIEDITVKGDKATVKMSDGESVQVIIDDFLNDDLSEFKIVKESGIMRHPSVVDAILQNESIYDKLQAMLIDTIDRIQADGSYIPQAEAINGTLKSIIELEKVRVSTLALLK